MQVLAFSAVLIQSVIQLHAYQPISRPLARILSTRLLPSGRLEVTVPFEDTYLYNGVRLARVRPYPCQQRMRGSMYTPYVNMGYCMPLVKFVRSGSSNTTTVAPPTTAPTTETSTSPATEGTTTTQTPSTATSSLPTTERSTTPASTTRTTRMTTTTRRPITRTTTTAAPTTIGTTTAYSTTVGTTTAAPTTATNNTMATTNATAAMTNATTAWTTAPTMNFTATTMNFTATTPATNWTASGPTTVMPIVASSQVTGTFTTAETPLGLHAPERKVRAPVPKKTAALERDGPEAIALGTTVQDGRMSEYSSPTTDVTGTPEMSADRRVPPEAGPIEMQPHATTRPEPARTTPESEESALTFQRADEDGMRTTPMLDTERGESLRESPGGRNEESQQPILNQLESENPQRNRKGPPAQRKTIKSSPSFWKTGKSPADTEERQRFPKYGSSSRDPSRRSGNQRAATISASPQPPETNVDSTFSHQAAIGNSNEDT